MTPRSRDLAANATFDAVAGPNSDELTDLTILLQCAIYMSATFFILYSFARKCITIQVPFLEKIRNLIKSYDVYVIDLGFGSTYDCWLNKMEDEAQEKKFITFVDKKQRDFQVGYLACALFTFFWVDLYSA